MRQRRMSPPTLPRLPLTNLQPPPTLPPPNLYSPASVVDDLAHNTTDVTVLLGKVEVTETSGVLVVVGVGLEDTTRLPLGTNDTLNVSLSSSATR